MGLLKNLTLRPPSPLAEIKYFHKLHNLNNNNNKKKHNITQTFIEENETPDTCSLFFSFIGFWISPHK